VKSLIVSYHGTTRMQSGPQDLDVSHHQPIHHLKIPDTSHMLSRSGGLRSLELSEMTADESESDPHLRVSG